MKTATDIRKDARESLKGKWGKTIAISFIYGAFVYIMNLIANKFNGNIIGSILNIAIAIVEVPLGFGLLISYIKLKRDEEVQIIDFIKDGFSNFKRSWGVALYTFLKMLVPIIILIVTIVALVVVSGGALVLNSNAIMGDTHAMAQSVSGWLVVVFAILFIASIVYVTIRSLLYIAANYIAYNNPEITTKEAVQKSAELMKGKRGSYFVLMLSFIGWAILSALSFGIGFIWLMPYINMATVCFYENLVEKTEE